MMDSYFKQGPEALLRALPRRVTLTDADVAKMKIPPWRYDEIEEAILNLFREVDARFIPLDPLAMAQAMGCGPIPYRSFGPIIHRILKEASSDALTIWLKDVPFILFNDRMLPSRCRFTVMHEIAHVRLVHREHSKLAEMEANRFSATALCPLPLLARSGLVIPADIARHFGISEDCARLRAEAFSKWRNLPNELRNRRFGKEICERFQMKFPVQPLLFQERASS